MARPPVGTGMKRQVSPVVAIIAIVAVVGLALLIGFGGPLWRSVTGKRVAISDVSKPGEIKGPADIKRVAGERLGVVFSHLPAPGGGGLTVTEIVPGSASELQVGDAVTSVGGLEVKGPGHMTNILQATVDVPVGQKVAVGVRRGGQTSTIQVTRREAKQSMGGGPGGRRGTPGAMGRG